MENEQALDLEQETSIFLRSQIQTSKDRKDMQKRDDSSNTTARSVALLILYRPQKRSKIKHGTFQTVCGSNGKPLRRYGLKF
jgi:hypothetical protein